MATRTRFIRLTFALSVVFNFAGGCLFAFPGSYPGQLVGLPLAIDPVYAVLTAYLVWVFAGGYAWLATQTEPNRPMVCFCALGKLGVFFIAVALWSFGVASPVLVVVASGDMAFSLLWLWWLAAGGD